MKMAGHAILILLHYSIVKWATKNKRRLQLIESVGLSWWQLSSEYWKGLLIISGCTASQGNCRTAMAEAFAKSLKDNGIESGMYWHMD